MKKALKIILPIVIVLAILGGAYWYFIQYNPLLTARILTNFGSSMENADHPNVAIRLYEWANRLDPRNGELTLKLAEAYRKSGSYTKTERCLVRAIQATPDNEQLYIRLSKVFLEQDKLLDAQTMLDSITSAAAADAIERLRPAPPVISPEGNYYNDYISVEISGGDGDTVYYYTTDGSFPSARSEAYAEPFRLSSGETTVCAVAVNPEGLVSHASYVGYTVAGVVEPVTLQDPALELMIREELHITSRQLRTDDLWGITELYLPDDLTTTEDLPYFTGLKTLVICEKDGLDYSFLSQLYALRHLGLDGCSLTTEDLTAIGTTPNLEELVLTDCGLSNVTPLGKLTGLRLLDLTDNSIGTADILTGMTDLEELYLAHNALTTLPDLSALQSLKIADLSYNALTGVDGLGGCAAMERLNLSNNRLTSVDPVGNLSELVFLSASINPVADLSALKGCTKLETFIMEDCKFDNIDFLEDIVTIREIDIDRNDTVAAPHFREDCMLETYSAAHNFLEDLSGLAGLQHLTLVNADYNNIRDIDVLLDCPVLAQVNVYGTYVHDGGKLAEKGVVVNFVPPFN